MNYKEAMDYIDNIGRQGIKYGLERTKRILEYLGNPQDELRCIHVAGTNGKGSTIAMICSILMKAGYRVGMYISPYLEEYEESIQINRANIPKDRFSQVISVVAEAADRVIAEGYDHPTGFEIVTCAMYLYFSMEKVDFAIIEVGLGGRLDSTNVITPLVSVITSISYDHMKLLGNTIEEISFHKAGIIKPGVPVVLYPQVYTGAEEVIRRVCGDNSSPLTAVERNSAKFIGSDGRHQNIIIKTERESYSIKLALLGKAQILNCATAVSTIEVLRDLDVLISREDIYEGLKSVEWKGRLEILQEKPLVIIDGAHNIDAVQILADSLKSYFKYDKLYLIIGILTDKQVDEMLGIIVPMAEKVITVTPHSGRAENAEALRDRIIKIDTDCQPFDDYEEAFEQALAYCREDDLLLVCGSLYMIGDMRKIIKKSGQ